MTVDPRCWREIMIRGGVMTIVAAIAYFFLHAQAWIWLFPVGISALVLFKWIARPQELDEEREEEQGV